MTHNKYYITFGSNHWNNGRLVLVIPAPDEQTARSLVFKLFGNKFCTSYSQETLPVIILQDYQTTNIVRALINSSLYWVTFAHNEDDGYHVLLRGINSTIREIHSYDWLLEQSCAGMNHV